MTKDSDRILILETNYLNMTQKLDAMDTKIDKNHLEIKDMIKDIKESFAAKRTETVLKGLIGLILVGVVGALLKLIIL